jgi:prepilin peptidase CpaA
MNIALATTTIITCLIAVYSDFRSRTISNYLNLISFFWILSILIFYLNFKEIQPYLWSGMISVIFMILAFYFKILGGGDAKLLMVLGFSIPITQLLTLWFFISIIGGLESLIFIIYYKKLKQKIPYALAICGGVVLFWSEKFY